jgi:hypothetical protein
MSKTIKAWGLISKENNALVNLGMTRAICWSLKYYLEKVKKINTKIVKIEIKILK